jgi:hypothetical protein
MTTTNLKDTYSGERSIASPGAKLTPVVASAADFTGPFPKALEVFVPTGTAGPHLTIVPTRNANGDTVQLTLNNGYQVYDAVTVRRVTAITAGVVVRRIDD